MSLILSLFYIFRANDVKSINMNGPFRGSIKCFLLLLSTPMGVDNVVIGFDMEVQPLVTHNAA